MKHKASTIQLLLGILERTGASYSDAAAGAGVSPSTMRMVELSGTLPARDGARLRIERWVALNADAHKRGDLRFVD